MLCRKFELIPIKIEFFMNFKSCSKIGKTKESIELPAIKHEEGYCTRHTDQKMIYYCNNCEKLVCPNCLPIKHKDHNIEENSTCRIKAKCC